MTGGVVKSATKRCMKAGAVWLAPLCRRSGSRILTFHSVGSRDHEMNVLPDAFAAQMAWLAEHCRVVTLCEAVDEPGSGVAITFDDGYGDNLVNAAPVLARLGLPATFFVVAGRVGGRLLHDEGRDHAELMSWGDLRRLRELGRFEIGCHTMTHPRLSKLSVIEQKEEIFDSCEILHQEFGEVTAFAYPFGSALDYTWETLGLVREAGFGFAVSNRYGVFGSGESRWECRRIWIDRSDTMESFRAKVRGDLDALQLLDSRPGIYMRRWMNALLRA